MGWLLGGLGLILFLTGLLYRYILFPAFTSPLAKLPLAHPLCAISSMWLRCQSARGRELRSLYAAHKRHGPIVRLAPREVSVVSEDGLRQVYVRGLDKSVWYQQAFYNYGVQNLVSTLDHKTHSTVRRMISRPYTKSFLQRSPDLDQLSRRIVIDRLLPHLRHCGKQRQEVNVVELFEYTSIDFITGYIWGSARSTDFLDDPAGRDRYFGEWERIRRSSDVVGKPITEALYMDMTRATIALIKRNKNAAGTQPLVVTNMFKAMAAAASKWQMTDDDIIIRCASEMVDHVIATQETNTIALTYILYRLSQHAELQDDLRREIRTLEPAIVADDVHESTLPNPADIDALPLLNSVVLETLRLHAPNPARMQRVVPSGGLTIHGCFIPAGTIISTNAYCLHRNAEVFPQPFEWIPWRWQSGAPDAMHRWFWAFGSGSRKCIGQNFAIQVIKLIVTSIYGQYRTSVIDDEGIEQSDSYNSGPVGHRLVLIFAPVENE